MESCCLGTAVPSRSLRCFLENRILLIAALFLPGSQSSQWCGGRCEAAGGAEPGGGCTAWGGRGGGGVPPKIAMGGQRWGTLNPTPVHSGGRNPPPYCSTQVLPVPRPHAQVVPTHTDAALPLPPGPSGHSSPLLASLPIPGRPLHSPLDIKHFLTFRLNGTSPLNLFPNFNTVSARGWGASAVGHLLPCTSARTLFQRGRVISGLIPGQHTCAMCPSIGANAEPEWGEGAAVMTPPPQLVPAPSAALRKQN